MAVDVDTVAIGLTGPFGSGCSTAARFLRESLNYETTLLSDQIRAQWKRNHRSKRPTRADLQHLGNQIREGSREPGEIARLALAELRDRADRVSAVVFDGIRNLGEVDFLRKAFGRNFYLFALECPASDRFARLQGIYGDDLRRFTEDNERDRDQEDLFGQQVELCVDAADVIIRNEDTVTLRDLQKKLVEYSKVATGESPRYARPDEILMNLAYSASHGSKCLKRQVGAVVVAARPNEMGDVLGQGFNENPWGTHPCVHEPSYGADPRSGISGRCYRDIVRSESYRELAEQHAHCPKCGERLRPLKEPVPPWRCAECRTNLDKYFWPERAMSLCTAVHAEVAAILSAGRATRGSTIYTTTFPCFQCAEKLAQAGITAVVFTEPYADMRAADRLDRAKIEMVRFEGIRSGRFDEIFSRARPYLRR